MAPNPKLTYVDRVVMEIIETERMYVKDLRSIVEDYLAHIIDVNNLPIRPEQVCALFGNIEDIYEFNSELLHSLDMCENDPVAIAQCFVEKSDYFEIYTQYCTNYPNSVAALTDCMRSKTLAKFFRDRQAALKRSLPLGSYLLKPVQRILKYHLLLQEIAKHFNPDEEGYDVVQEAIDTMTGVAWYINDMKRKHEHAVRVQEIQSLLINWKGPDLTTYGELVLEGTFHVLRAKNTRSLFLFERMLLITKRRGEHYVYKTHISCSTLMLLDNAKDPLLFSVIHFKHPKQPHAVQAKSMEEKRLWAHHIKRLILENHNAIIPQKAKEATLDNSHFPGKHHYSPKGLKKSESQRSEEFHLRGRNERRRSEPAKQIIRTSKAILKHADSEGALLGERHSLRPAASVDTLASGMAEPQAGRPSLKELIPRSDSLGQLSSAESGCGAGEAEQEQQEQQEVEGEEEEEEEEDSYKEDILMGDDQVADFASSVLAAISCWHYKAKALLSTHFTTDDQNDDLAEVTVTQSEATGAERQEVVVEEEEQKEGANVEEVVVTQVSLEELCLQESVPREHSDMQFSARPKSPVSPQREEEEEEEEVLTPEAEEQDSSRETVEEAEAGSDSSGLPAEDTSTLTNGELSEEEELLLSGARSLLPSSVLDQASAIAERFAGSLSRRSSLVSEELGPVACPSPPADGDVFQSPSACMDLESRMMMTPEVASTPEPAAEATAEAELRSTLSKRDRLLIHKIRRYYEHAEHQDVNFCIKRRESLSYIPAGLVRHLSRQLNGGPQGHPTPVHRKGPSRHRPTSWSVFDLPGLDKSQNSSQMAEPQRSPAEDERGSELPASDEGFRLSADVFKDQRIPEEEQDAERIAEEEQDAERIAEEDPNDGRTEAAQDVQSSSEAPSDAHSNASPVPSPTAASPAAESPSRHDSPKTPPSQARNHFNRSHLPKIIHFRTSADEDQILEDMGKMKNKVFQLARQYSQRIKNNRPMAWQRNRAAASQQGLKTMPAVQEEKLGQHGLQSPPNTCSEALIQEERSPSPVQSPRSGPGSHSTQSLQPDAFHWPHVQELRTKYAPGATTAPCSCAEPGWPPKPSATNCTGCFNEYNSSSDPQKAPAERPRTLSDASKQQQQQQQQHAEVEDWPRAQLQPLLCRWSSLDHMLGSFPLHEVQNLQEPLRMCHYGSQANLTTRESHKRLNDERLLLQTGSDCATKSLKLSESNLVRSLREKFQSLSSSS
ncbi:pleckstrin homology domain-containing family G member 3-like isoform X2 [Nelusetta ayraudi]